METSLTWLIVIGSFVISALVAQRLRIATPIMFLLGGIMLSLIPGMKPIAIAPEYMLLLFLPPILMEAAFFTSIRDFRKNLRPILFMAIGLVIVTSVAVAGTLVALLPGATLALGMLLGAIISPPDAAAATSALKHVRIPKRIQTILEGESLVNDASGLILFQFAVIAIVTGAFSWSDAATDFAWMVVGGAAIGWVFARLFVWIHPHINEPSIAILTTFIPPYAAFMLANEVHASGVIAVVVAGLVVGWHAAEIFTPKFRMPAEIIWKMVVFFLNALAFTLIGLNFIPLLEGLKAYDPWQVTALVAAVCAVCVLVRFVYVFGVAYGQRALSPKLRARDPYPPWQNVFVISWCGMRGVVTLATALAIPFTLADGSAFPHRDLLLFTALCVILFTLVIQGISLPWLLRKLTLSFDPKLVQEEWLARVQGARQALQKLDELAMDSSIHLPALSRIRSHYEERLESLGDGPNTPLYASETPQLANHPILQAENRIWRDVLAMEQQAIIRLRKEFHISDDVMHELFREIDLLASRFHYVEESPLAPAEQKRAAWRARLFKRAA